MILGAGTVRVGAGVDASALRRVLQDVILSGLGRQLKVCRQKSRSQFGDELFHRIAFIAETLAPEFSGKA